MIPALASPNFATFSKGSTHRTRVLIATMFLTPIALLSLSLLLLLADTDSVRVLLVDLIAIFVVVVDAGGLFLEVGGWGSRFLGREGTGVQGEGVRLDGEQDFV